MWSHYADKHQGIVVEFDTDQLLDGILFHHVVCEVNYRTNRVSFSFEHILNEFPLRAAMDESMKTKSINWSYEKEVRIILHSTDFTEMNPIEVPFNPICVRRIISGVNASKKTQEGIASLMREQAYSHVNLGKAEIHPTDYKLVVGKF